MDSRTFHRAIGMNGGSDQPNAAEVDLTLTLGLPVNPIYVASQQGNPDFINGPYAPLLAQGMMPNGGGNINPIPMKNSGIISGIEGHPFMTQQYYNPNAHQELIGSSHATGYMMNNSNGQLIMGSAAAAAASVGVVVNNLNSDLPAPTMKEYTLLNISNRRSTTGRKKSYNNNVNDPHKQCSNYNCRTSCTPMWRKGPLGLNTLCNSCGIKYRKEWKRKQDNEQEMMKKLQEGRGGTSDDAQDND